MNAKVWGVGSTFLMGLTLGKQLGSTVKFQERSSHNSGRGKGIIIIVKYT